MKPLSFREVKRKLEAAGFAEIGQTGSHKIRQNYGRWNAHCDCSQHREVAAGTLRSVLRQAGISAGNFEKL
jgi:predicted RNA binding protein YcfA (HicA-like mRNA interferase family)